MAFVMEARFPGTCCRCLKAIPKGAAISWDKETRKAWHVECEHLPIQEIKRPEISEDVLNIPMGIFTVVFPDQSYQTIRIRKKKTGGMKGKVLAEYLAGPDNDFSYQGFAFVYANGLAVWKRYKENKTPALERWVRAYEVITRSKEDAEKAGLEYAMQSGNCCKCGATLTVPASLNRGMGPDCAKRYG